MIYCTSDVCLQAVTTSKDSKPELYVYDYGSVVDVVIVESTGTLHWPETLADHLAPSFIQRECTIHGISGQMP
jgi:hypothetical protein